MKILIFYDITETKIRNQIIDLLFDYNFQRIQFSVFLGEISKKRIRRLYENVSRIINYEEDSLYVFNLCDKDFKDCFFLGKIINKQFLDTDFLIF